MAHQAQGLGWQEPPLLPEPALAQEKEIHNIFAALQNSDPFFPGSQFHIVWRRRKALVLTLDVSPRPASEEAVSSPTFQGSHRGLIKT